MSWPSIADTVNQRQTIESNDVCFCFSRFSNFFFFFFSVEISVILAAYIKTFDMCVYERVVNNPRVAIQSTTVLRTRERKTTSMDHFDCLRIIRTVLGFRPGFSLFNNTMPQSVCVCVSLSLLCRYTALKSLSLSLSVCLSICVCV